MTPAQRITELRAKAALLRRKAGVAGYLAQQQQSTKLVRGLQAALTPAERQQAAYPPRTNPVSATAKVDDANQRFQNVRVTRKSATNEWVVLRLDFADCGYFTDDVDDAIATAELLDHRISVKRNPVDDSAGDRPVYTSTREGVASILICFSGPSPFEDAEELRQRFEYYIRQDRPAKIKTWLNDLGLHFVSVKVHDCKSHPLG